MKIYFGFTMAGDRSGLAAARRIVDVLGEMGHEVLTRHLVSDGAWEMDRRITARQVYERDMAWLEACEALVSEVSGSSFGLGYETAWLLAQGGRRVFLFYREDAAEKISRLITGNSHPMCTLVPYTDARGVEALVRAHVGPAQS